MSRLPSRHGERARHSVASLHAAKPEVDELGTPTPKVVSSEWLRRMAHTQTQLCSTQGVVSDVVTRMDQLRSQLDRVHREAALLMGLRLGDLSVLRNVLPAPSHEDSAKRNKPQRGDSSLTKRLAQKEKSATRESELAVTRGRAVEASRGTRNSPIEAERGADGAPAVRPEVIYDSAGNALDERRRQRVMTALSTLFGSPANSGTSTEMDTTGLIAGSTNTVEHGGSDAPTTVAVEGIGATNSTSRKGGTTRTEVHSQSPRSGVADATCAAEVAVDSPRCPRDVPAALWDDMLQLRYSRLQIDAELAMLAECLVRLEMRRNILQRSQLLCRYAVGTPCSS